MSNTERIINATLELLATNKVRWSVTYENNMRAFLKQCPDDGMLAETNVYWDTNGREIDIIWDSSNLDVRFSIGKKETRWKVWIGENHHRKDDKQYSWGFGGEPIDKEGKFAYYFFDCLGDFWQSHKEYWSPYREENDNQLNKNDSCIIEDR